MAHDLGLAIVTYKRLEAGKREATAAEVEHIAEITGLPLDFFVGDLSGLGDARANREQLEHVRSQLGTLVGRLEDLEWRMRQNLGGEDPPA